MTHVRFCPRCGSDVEDVGGFCLLGHRFPALPGSDPIAELRAQVDEAFHKVQTDVAAALDPLAGLARENDAPVPVTSQASAETAPSVAEDDLTVERLEVTSKALWQPLEDESPLSGSDPIVAFAPSPRMDWGPERAKRGRSSKRPRTA